MKININGRDEKEWEKIKVPPEIKESIIERIKQIPNNLKLSSG